MNQAIQSTIKRNGMSTDIFWLDRKNNHGLDTDKSGENCHLFNTL